VNLYFPSRYTNLWLSICLSPVVFLVFYDIVFVYLPLIRGDGTLPTEFIVYMVCVNLVMTYILLWLYLQLKKRETYGGKSSTMSPHRAGLGWQGHLFMVVLTTSLFFYLVFNVFGSFDLSNVYENNQMFYAKSKVGTAWVYFFLQAFVFTALYDIYLTGNSKFKIICVLLLILINAATGGRSNVITYLFFFIIIYGVIWRGRYILIVGGSVLILVFSTFLYNTLSRSGMDNISEYMETKSSIADFNQLYAIADSIDYWNDNGACNTCLLEDLSYFFIPRRLYPDKPISNAETRRVYPEVAARGTTQTFGLYGGSILNLGLFSFIFIPVFYFFYTYAFFSSIYTRRKSYLSFFFIYCGVNAVQFVRGGVLDIRLIRLFVTFLLAYLIYQFFLVLFGKHILKKCVE